MRIFPHLRLEVHCNGNIHIEDDVVISQNVHITSAGDLTIGKSSLILANVLLQILTMIIRNWINI